MTQSDIDHLRSLQRAQDFEAIDALLDRRPDLQDPAAPGARLVLAVIAGLRNDEARFWAFSKGLDESPFESSADLADLAMVYLLRNEVDRAETLLRECTVAADADGYAFARLGTIQLMKNQLEAAGENLRQALVRVPDEPNVLSNLGGVRLRQDRLDEALACYERALAIRPDFQVAQEQRSRVYIAKGQAETIVAEREDRLEQAPDDLQAYLGLANVQAHLDRREEAQATLERAVERFPDEPAPKRALVQNLFQWRKWWQAGKKLLAWHEADPDNLELRIQLNRARVEIGFLDAAEADLAAWDAEQKQAPGYALVKARLLSERHRWQDAVQLLEEALERYPGLIDARGQLVHLLNQLGRTAEAQEHQQAMMKLAPGAVVDAIATGGGEASEAELNLLRRVKDAKALGREQRAQAAFGLARVLDRQADYDGAFAALNDANGIAREGLSYDWRTHRRQVQGELRTFTPTLVDRLQGAGHDSQRPIFVLGMPRSGTTLTEQILASHPRVYGGGEMGVVPRITRLMRKVAGGQAHYPGAVGRMKPAQIRDAGRYYLDRVAEIEDESDFVVDKLPHNFDHIGLIALMLSNAKIVHLKRDPRDVAVSNYFQNFGAKQGLMGFAFDLGDIGHMLNDHDRIMAHWHALFPGRIYELDYAALVRDPETEIAKLLDFCGLPWDDAVLNFQETERAVKTASVRQVREGIYTTSDGKWRRYESHLGPLETVLAEGFQPVGPAAGGGAASFDAGAGTTEAGLTGSGAGTTAATAATDAATRTAATTARAKGA